MLHAAGLISTGVDDAAGVEDAAFVAGGEDEVRGVAVGSNVADALALEI